MARGPLALLATVCLDLEEMAFERSESRLPSGLLACVMLYHAYK